MDLSTRNGILFSNQFSYGQDKKKYKFQQVFFFPSADFETNYTGEIMKLGTVGRVKFL